MGLGFCVWGLGGGGGLEKSQKETIKKIFQPFWSGGKLKETIG